MHYLINSMKFVFYYADYIVFYLIIAYMFKRHVAPLLKRSDKDRKLFEKSILVEIKNAKIALRDEKRELKRKVLLFEKINRATSVWKRKKECVLNLTMLTLRDNI